jgi:RHS repeat-associated protein
MMRSFARSRRRFPAVLGIALGVLVGAVVLSTVDVATATAQVSSAAAARKGAKPPKAHKTKPVKGVHAVAHQGVHRSDSAATAYRATRRHLPSTGTMSSVVPTSTGTGRRVRLGASMVSVQEISAAEIASGGRVTVSVLPKARADARDLDGVMFTLAAAGSHRRTVKATIDYSSFAQFSGGGYGPRLGLVLLPDCAASSSDQCPGQEALRSINDANRQTLSATLTLPVGGRVVLGITPHPVTISPSASAVVPSARPQRTASVTPAVAQKNSLIAVQAATSASGGASGDGGGPGGSYAATTLSPSASWSEGGSTGSFTYSYPISLPASASALKPSVALGYDSGSVDAKTSATAAQSSWVGDGWSTPQSYIEQSYRPCPDVSSSLTNQDSCYAGPIVTMSLGGQSTQLICDAAFTSCTPQQDDGSVVKRVTGGTNGTYDGDYWTITKRDGTVYSFGLNQLPGFATGNAVTNSVQTVPVYSANATDPCYHKTAATFAGSVCTMGYRWNLDYVKDVHGQAMSYYYTKSTNYYGQNKGASNVSYVRDAYLNHIDYGFTAGNAYGTVPDKVLFTSSTRCLAATCAALSSTTAANYPDVPFDLVCASGATCAVQSPSFFSTARLTAITTQQYNTVTAGYVSVDKYTLTQTIPSATSGDTPTLWLASLQRTGYSTDPAGTTTSLTTPTVSFTGNPLQNRVDTTTVALPPMFRNRIGSITTETGSVLTVLYDQANPCSSPVTVSAASNTSSCFPVSWTPQGYVAPVKDWFIKYVVVAVNQSDTTGGAPALNTSYSYPGGAAWHYDDNEVVRSKYRSYGQFRGYGDVKTFLGDGSSDAKTLNETTYYRGMSKNNNSTVVNVTDSLGGTHEDADLLQGDVLETRQYQGSGGELDNGSITSYWQSATTATRVRAGLNDLNAHIIAIAETLNQQAVTSASTTTYRRTETDTSYDTSASSPTYGLPQFTYSHSVPVNAAYDQCTSTTYAKANTTLNLVALVAGTETDSVACAGFTQGSPVSVPDAFNTLSAPTTVSRPDQVVSATRSFYDVTSFATTFPQTITPTLGNVTLVQGANGATSGALTWLTKAKNVYDSRGRLTSTIDTAGHTSTTAYTDNANGLTTAMTVTNTASQATSATLDTQRGLALTVTDPNALVTTTQYDALGRVTALWLANRATSTPANYTYEYVISKTAVSAATTSKLNSGGGYVSSVLLYDSLLRPRQTQSLTPQGGRMVTDTIYDTRGWVKITNNGWWDSATTPNTTIVTATDLTAQVPNSDRYTYDGLGRAVVDSSRQNVTEISTSSTIYGGDRTTVIPPAGGVTQTSYTDVLGRTTKLAQYTSAPTIAAPANTTTGHWSLTGGTTTATTYGYDGHGNQATTTDPAGNEWTSTYNLLGQITSRKDPDAGTSTSSYDSAGNLTQATDARGQSTSFTYDVLGRKTASYASTTAEQVAFGDTGANQTAKWVYDNSDTAVASLANAIGHVTTATAYSGGGAYVTQAKAFTAFGASTGQTITIPATENSNLAGTYTYNHTYLASTGLPYRDTYAAATAAGLPAETMTHGYKGALDEPDGLSGTIGTTSVGYNGGVDYDAYGRVSQTTLGSAGTTGMAYLTNTYDQHTGLLTDQLVSGSQRSPSTIDEHAYTYDLAGNTTKDTETRLANTATSETQCYAFDPLQHLSSAWTATDNCAATPTTAAHASVGDGLGTSSAYWSSWTYNALGQRTTQVAHATGTGSDTTTTYKYNGNSAAQPTTLTSTDTTGATTSSTGYEYDATGNMKTRNAADGAQTLTWDNTGRLASTTTTPPGSSTATTSTFTYDTDGNLLTQHDGAATILYLPGQQLSVSATGTLSGVRYYGLPGGGTAYRTGTGTAYGYKISDAHNTSALTLDYTGQNPTWRQFTPFGQTRGSAATWVDNRTFLDKTTDTTTGLTNVGARYYDPVTAQFISLDPLFSPTDPQSLNGYAYANQNPVTFSDPTGLKTDPGTGGSAPVTSAPCDWPASIRPSGCSPNTNTPGVGGGGGSSNSGGNNAGSATGGGSTRSQPEHHGWVHWPSWHTVSEIGVGVAVGLAVTVTVATGCLGVVGCAVLAAVAGGAAGGAATYANSVALGDDEFSVRGLATNTAIGGAAGGLTAGAGAVVGSVAKSVFSRGVAAAAETGAATAERAAAPAAKAIGKSGASKAAAAGCFVAGTQVLMADGTSRAIEDVKVGDKVTSRDVTTGHEETHTVVRTFRHEHIPLFDVTVAGKKITTTAEHPFFVEGKGWTPVKDLTSGDPLVEPDGATVAIDAVTATGRTATVYNFEVENTHDYYIHVGTHWVLVHNNCDGRLEEAGDWLYRGVAKDHPGYEEALKGNAFPRNPEGQATAMEHNRVSADDSPFTSWTDMLSTAKKHAKEGGVILRFPQGIPPAGAPYKFEMSPDVYWEREVLVRGPIEGAEVFRL